MFIMISIDQYESRAMATKLLPKKREFELTEWSIISVGRKWALVGASNHAFTEQLMSPKVNT